MNYKTIVGLETHVELSTEQKMFCGCYASHFNVSPNTNVCPVCLGLPGALPVPNYQAIKWTILIGMALNCKINTSSFFERKHYFYPDLPKGYQISQYQKPLCENGFLMINNHKIRINRVHLEEDTGKLLHGEQFNEQASFVDFNRSGVPLVEIVTEPDIDSPEQASAYLKTLQLIIQYLKASDCDMEKGSMRCEPNISVVPLEKWHKSKQLPNYKVEVKNINSFKFVKQAIEYERERQIMILQKQQVPKQETRRYVESTKTTQSMRTKEVAQDYRYFPEPDIPPLQFSASDIKALETEFKNLPNPKKRLIDLETKHKLSLEQARQLTENQALGDRYLQLVKLEPGLDKIRVANLLINKKVDLNLTNLALIKKLKEKLSTQTLDSSLVGKTISQVLDDNQKAVTDYHSGKNTAMQFLLGQCLKVLGRQVEVEKIRKELSKQLIAKQ